MSKYILFLFLLIGCGGGSINQETTVQETEKYTYKFSVNKTLKTDTFQLYEVDFKDNSTYLVFKLKWINEYGFNDSKDFRNGIESLSIYFPYTELNYEVFNYNTNEIYEKGKLNGN